MTRAAPRDDGEPITLLDVCPRPRSQGAGTGAGAFIEHRTPVPAALALRVQAFAKRLSVPAIAVYAAAVSIVQDQLTGSSVQDLCVDAGQGVRHVSTRVEPGALPVCIALIARELDTASAAAATRSALTWRLDAGHETALVASYDPATHDNVVIAQLAGYVLRVADTLARDGTRPDEFVLVSDIERERLLAISSGGGIPPAPDDTVHGVFARQAKDSPQAIAVEAGERRWTYAQLAQKSRSVRAALIAAGVNPGERIGLALERSPEAVAAVLGILEAGCVYVPLDTTLPAERIGFMLNDAGIRYVIAGPEATITAPHVLHIAELLAFEDSTAVRRLADIDARSGAYVMYTSGSTGMPKGVEIRHESILRLVRNVAYVRLGHGLGMLHAAPLGFDASTLEIWGPLLNGGRCVIHPERVPTAAALQRTVREHHVETAWLTASLFNVLVEQDVQCLGGLRELLIGGEALSVPHVKRALSALPELTLINGYGPTECTTFTATHAITRPLADDITSIPIGKPIANTRCHVLNARGDLVPSGFIGELYVGGAGVAHGYLHRPELTAERFVPDTLGGGSSPLYRTGDLVRQLPDGTLEYFGRRDGQVKIRGFRIETGEVEVALARVPGVRSCAVIARRDGAAAESQLVAYVVPTQPAPQASALRDALAAALPRFMVPGAYVFLDSLPVTVNGKLDRRALPAPTRSRPDIGEPYAAPVDAPERELCALFARVLDLDRVGRTDQFFDLGGSSLAAVRLAAAIAREMSVDVGLPTIFQHPTPATLAVAIERGRSRAIPQERLPRRPSSESSRAAVAIIAVAGKFPGAADVDTFWSNLLEGREGVRTFAANELDPSLDAALVADPHYVRRRGVLEGVDQFDAAFFGITPKEAELMDPQQRVFLELCWECLERGGYTPESAQGPVGVFAGMYNASYFQQHIAAHPDKVEQLGAFLVMLANEKDYIATRVAHKLDLTGPAVSVHTACSTSLVAIAQAVASLRAGQCDLALAGGSSIVCPPNSGYLYQEGAMLSPDGHTRTFDSHAAGTTFSDGAAVLLLKRADDALRDGDHVIALIRGVAINNDGGRKASFTAPSVDGQAAVIATALDDAGVEAASISYVEAHGTATPIGDPIEIEGLTKAFRRHTDEVGFCAIGSVKSNVGHLVIAAGAAGAIKTALALHHERIPPNANYQAPNPAIPFSTSPFHVADRLIEWPRGHAPRRAGVSSFGVGGTNAHVLMEEAPVPAPRVAASGAQLLVLSARSETALDTAIANLSRHLAAHADTDLGDAAHTLRVGRKQFAHRAFVVASDTREAATLLASPDRTRVPRRKSSNGTGVVFMFPGQGAQYVGMGSALHAHDAVFRAAFDEVCEAVRGELDDDLARLVFNGDAERLAQTSVTQPATFAIEYALARLWLARGVTPRALIGHSVGEFVAAVLAGVMSLTDAARLVARRGRLMQAQPGGAMLSVRAGADRLTALLPPELSLAALNGPGASVVAGTHDAIAAFQRKLETENVPARLLQTSHAFHSAMMDPAIEPFARAVRDVRLAAPSVPIVSTLTGEWLTNEQATDPAYWARHLRETVRFSPAVRVAAAEAPAVMLEIGPRTTLATLARQHFAPGTASPNCVASLADSPESEIAALLAAHGQLWLSGIVSPAGQLSDRERRRVPLPTYPFEHRRYWLEARPRAPGPAAALAPASASTPASAPVADATLTSPGATSLIHAIPSMELSMPASSPAAQADRVPQIVRRLRGVFEDVAGLDMGDADASMAFVELGLDSLSLTQVALQLQKAFGVKIAFRQLMESYSSLDLLARFLDAQMPAEAAPAAAPIAASAVPAMQPIAIAPSGMSAAPNAPFMQQLIQQQMQIMAQQLALLSGAAAVAPMPMPPVPAAPAAAAANTAPANVAPTTPAPTSAAATSPVAAADEPAGMIKYDVQKAFGAIARIHTKGSQDVTDRQRARLDAFMRRYIARTQKSKAYTQEHRAHLADPRVVNGFRPQLKEMIYQIVIERSQGPYVWDLDGNKYVDALNGFGMNLFGWQPSFVLDAVRKQLDAGYEIGPQHPLAGDVARKICAMTGFDRAGLCNTGSEAVMGAIRIARTVTGRSRIALFTGAYHGIFDEVIVRATRKQKAYPAAPGIMPNTAENVLVLDYGTPESLEILRANADELAAVLIEPVQSRRPDFQPREFLQEVRALTKASGTLCIFDEVVTGFRSHPRGAQSVLGIDADLASYGKVVGGGFPIGVIAGKREYMDALDGGHWQFGDDSVPTVGPTYFAGTFVRHPLALAAANAVLDHLEAHGAALQDSLNARTTAMVQEINTFLESVGAPITVKNFSSVWKTFFTEDHPLQDLLFAMMRSRGIHILDNFPCFMTTAHAAEDIAAIVTAFKESVIELQEADFIPRRKPSGVPVFDASRPPVPGARLGRDADGRPAWFAPNPDAPGKFLKVS